MELPATSGAGAPDAPLLATDHQDAADLQRLYDAANPSETAPADGSQDSGSPADPETEERPDLDNAAVEGEAEGTEAPAETAAQAQAAGAAPEAEKDYDSLDAYLKDQKLEPESFMQLPVAVKVDGKEQAVPLAELVKGYQLSSASYARMNEAAQLRQQLSEEQTRTRQAFATEQSQVRQALGARIHQVEALAKAAQDALLADYDQVMKSPQWAQMQPGERAEVSLAYQQRQTQIQQLMQQAAQARQQEAEQAKQAQLQALPGERERLLQARPQWRDPAKAQAAHKSMTDLGRKLGFSDAELAGVSDHRHLLVLDMAARYQPVHEAASKLGVSDAELLNMAAEFAKLKAKTPQTLKRVRMAPKMAAPGTRQPVSPKGGANPKLDEAWLATGGRNDQLGAAVFERFV